MLTASFPSNRRVFVIELFIVTVFKIISWHYSKIHHKNSIRKEIIQKLKNTKIIQKSIYFIILNPKNGSSLCQHDPKKNIITFNYAANIVKHLLISLFVLRKDFMHPLRKTTTPVRCIDDMRGDELIDR